MTATRIHIDNHSGPVEVETYDGDVHLGFLPDEDDEVTVWRSLTAEDARAIAAALCHYANEVDR